MTREAREDLLLSGALPLAVHEALRAMFGSKVPPPSADTAVRATLRNPYRGLLVFGVQDAPLFFGRAKRLPSCDSVFDAAVISSSEAGLVSPRLVAVLGPSGVANRRSHKLGEVAVNMGQLGKAKVCIERSLKIREKLALAGANDAQAQCELIVSHYKRADLYHRFGSPSVARSKAQVAATLLAMLRPRLTKSVADSFEQALRALLR